MADELFEKMNRTVQHRMELMLNRAAGYKEYTTTDDAYKVLFASETGCAEVSTSTPCVLVAKGDETPLAGGY